MKHSAIITGATGYVGSHVARHLTEIGWDVAVICRPDSDKTKIRDIENNIDVFDYNGNIDSLIKYFKDKRPCVVIHIAAAVITNPTSCQVHTLLTSNIEFGTHILEAMRVSGCRLFINTGSYWQNFESETYNPVDLYSATKEAFEKIIKYYVEAFDFRVITLRLFDIYGDDDVRPKLWNTLKRIAGTDEVLDISRGEQLIDLVHISDVVLAYECALDMLMDSKEIRNEIFGVYTGDMHPLREVVELFEKILGKKINLNWGGRAYKAREVMFPYEGYRRLDNWQPKVTIEEGFGRFKCIKE